VSNLEQIQTLLSERGLSALEDGARALASLETAATEAELEEFFGHGPLRSLLEEETVTEVLVNGPAEIWAERDGRLTRAPGAFASEDSLRRYVRRLLGPQGRKVDPRAPFADAVIEGGVRVHVAAPPISRRGLCLSLRKPAREPWTLERFVARGTFSAATASLLRTFVAEKRNIFV
jgi:pilus assembly protein CpaF